MLGIFKKTETKKEEKSKKFIYDLKALLKEKAKEIRALKLKIKDTQRKGEYAGSDQWKLVLEKSAFRHHHIAYCELRGRTRDQIEKPSEDNLPSETKISNIKAIYGNWPERKAEKETQQ